MIVTRGGQTFETREKQCGAPVPDSQWSCIDVNGHRHAWVFDELRRSACLPTCRIMSFIEFFQGSEVRSVLYECASCGVPIEPGRVVETTREYLVDGHEVSEGDFFRAADRSGVYCPHCQERLVLEDQDDSADPLPIVPTTISDLYRCQTHGLWRYSPRAGLTRVES